MQRSYARGALPALEPKESLASPSSAGPRPLPLTAAWRPESTRLYEGIAAGNLAAVRRR